MEELTKTQVVLLTLFVSFVTSIATGIVTITLLEQAPVGVTQTINKVVEHTVERIIPGQSTTTVTVKEVLVTGDDVIPRVVESSKGALVRITAPFVDEAGESYEKSFTGAIVSNDYIVSAREISSSSSRDLEAVLSTGEKISLQVLSLESAPVTLLKIAKEPGKKLAHLSLAEKPPRLGDQLIAFGYQGKSTSITLGRVVKVDESSASSTPVIVSDISSDWPILSTAGLLLAVGRKDGRLVIAYDLLQALKVAATVKISSSPILPSGGQQAAVGEAVGGASTSTPLQGDSLTPSQ